MNYLKVYNNIIKNAKNDEQNRSNVYCEVHHIVPQCIGGTNDNDNLVRLTLKEHYVCHKLLTKIYPNNKKIIHAFWMMTITTLGSYKKFNDGKYYKPDGEMINRIKCFISEDNKFNVSGRDYEYAREIYRNMMLGHEISTKTRKRISLNTQKGMKKSDTFKKCQSGSLGCRHYRNKFTGERHKWFPGDPDIDLTIYEWGRGPMSIEQREKISKIKFVNKCWIYNKELNIKYCVYDDYVNSDIFVNYMGDFGWEKRNVPKPNNQLYLTFVRRVSNELKRKGLFDINDLLFFKTNFTTEKPRKFISPSFFILCKNLLEEYVTDKSDEFINSSLLFIINNKQQLKDLNNIYLK